MQNLYDDLAAAYVRGMRPELADDDDIAALLEAGRASGLELHRFKRTRELPRVAAVIGALRGIYPATLLDIGAGRGVFLWPLLDAFPDLAVSVVERDARRLSHLDAVRRGGITRLHVDGLDAARLSFEANTFDVVTVLEVLEHQESPALIAREATRVAKRFVIASVPSKADNNPEHVQFFTGKTLAALLIGAGAASVNIDYVLNHIIAVARVS